MFDMSLKILIYGAGAIGRGFLAPYLHRHNMRISFVDANRELINQMKLRKSYKTAFTDNGDYKITDVIIDKSYYYGEEEHIDDYDIVFSCVGPNNCYNLAERFKKARTVISCENDDSTVIKLRKLSGNDNIFFGIPDVITSNTASEELLKQDTLMTVSEQGILVLEKGNYVLPEEISQVGQNELRMHWFCKLFIHNAPHAILAYLGWLQGYQFIHEAMDDADISEVVVGSISEITDGLVGSRYATKEFAEAYKHKELSRFRNKLLFDPITRVAREPIRKIGKDNRIILGMRLAIFNGILTKYTAIGAKAALIYDNPNDKEAVYLQSLRESVGDAEVLEKYSGIEKYDPLSQFIINQDLSIFMNGRLR